MANAPHDLRLRLVFSGELIPGHDPQAVRWAVAAALKLSQKNTERLFSGKHIVLKQQVDAAYAARQITRFAKMGAVLRTEPMARQAAALAPTPPTGRSALLALGALLAPLRTLRRPAGRPALVALGALACVLISAGFWFASREGAPTDAAPSRALAQPQAQTQTKPTAMVNTALPPTPSPVADEDLPRQLSAQAAQDYRKQYWPAAWHKAFAVAASGAHAWVTGAASEKQARQAALSRCSQVQPTVGNTCRVVDVNGEPQD